MAGKADWLATALPSEGSSATLLDARTAVRGDDIVCHLDDRLGDSIDRVQAAGKDVCIVVDDHHVVLGRVRGRALDGDPRAVIENVMQSGPSTIRPDTPLEAVVKTLRDGNVNSTLVTDIINRITAFWTLQPLEAESHRRNLGYYVFCDSANKHQPRWQG